jgi:hypothetical protein
VTGFTDRSRRGAENDAKRGGSIALRRGRFKGVPEMTDTALSALVTAWTATMIATTLLLSALALSRVWDSAIYLQGLQGLLNLDV